MNYFSIPGFRSIKKQSIKDAIQMTAEYFDIPEQRILSKGRSQSVVKARQMLSYYLHTELGVKPGLTGDYLNRDRTTIMYCIQSTDHLLCIVYDYEQDGVWASV